MRCERRLAARFPTESLHEGGPAGETLVEDFQRHDPISEPVDCLVNDAHAPRAEFFQYPVVREAGQRGGKVGDVGLMGLLTAGAQRAQQGDERTFRQFVQHSGTGGAGRDVVLDGLRIPGGEGAGVESLELRPRRMCFAAVAYEQLANAVGRLDRTPVEV